MICKLLGEIDSRVKRIVQEHNSYYQQKQQLQQHPSAAASLSLAASFDEQHFIEEWTMLTWNVLCITSRLQNSLAVVVRSTEDRVIFSKLNGALVELVNHTRTMAKPPPFFTAASPLEGSSEQVAAVYDLFTNRLAETMHMLHGLYRTLKAWPPQQPLAQADVEAFSSRLQQFGDQHLVPFVDMFKASHSPTL